MYNVYLGGPIQVDYNEKATISKNSIEWRKYFKKEFSNIYDVYFIDPVIHAIPYFIGEDKIVVEEDFQKFKNDIGLKDLELISQSHVGVFNLEEFDNGYPCVGSLVEIGIFKQQCKPILIHSRNKHIINSPMLIECFIFDDLKLLIETLKEFIRHDKIIRFK